MIFRDPWILFLLPILFVLLFIRSRFHKEPGFLFSSDLLIKKLQYSIKPFLASRLYWLKVLAVSLVIIAMARPLYTGNTRIKKEGIAIVVAIDCSSTMLAEDLKLELEDMARLSKKKEDIKKINRIDAALYVAEDFIEDRSDDMIGVVVFAASAFLVCPLTFDHEWLLRSMRRIKVGLIKDGTAIGSGILSSINSLKDIKARSRIVVLITDGVNNYGQISPVTAAKAARAMGIKIYTIGITSGGAVDFSVKDEYGREKTKKVYIPIREEKLKEIADITGGDYFRAEDMKTLRESYDEINRLEKTEMEEKSYDAFQDVFQYFLFAALGLMLCCMILSNTVLRKIP